MAEGSLVDSWLLAGKHAYWGRHRTEVTVAAERNGAWMAEGSLVDSLASERKVKSEPTIPQPATMAKRSHES